MSRYKGRTNTKAIEQAYPHIVEMIVPLGGFGLKLDDMYEWHWARGIEAMRGCGRVMRAAASMSDGALLIPQQRKRLQKSSRSKMTRHGGLNDFIGTDIYIRLAAHRLGGNTQHVQSAC